MFNDKDDIKLTDTKSTKLDAERSKREDFMTYDNYDLKCGCHAEPGMFSRHVDCHLDHKNHIP